MNSKSLWLGLGVLWLVAAGVAAVFVLAPDEPVQVKTGEDVVGTSDQAPADVAPLKNIQPQREVLPEPTAAEETPAKPADKTPATDPSETKPEKRDVPPVERADVIVRTGVVSETGSDYQNVSVAQGGTLKLPAGEVSIAGNLSNLGTVEAAGTTLILDGADQRIEGNITAGKVIMRGGTKHIRSGTFGTASTGTAGPGNAQLYVEAGTTLIIEEGGKWNTPNAYGFQIAGSLVIDGGEFHCEFSNGNGDDRGEKSWLPGSALTIYQGKFIGSGDADFGGATITIHDGALEIHDDIWSTGAALNMYGGVMRNDTSGGMFCLTGAVSVSGGKLQVYQSGDRGLLVSKDASVFCTGGEVSINGSPPRGGGGIKLLSSATFSNLKINTSTKINTDSVEGSYLSVGGDFQIAKGQKFEASGYQVIASIPSGGDAGEFVP